MYQSLIVEDDPQVAYIHSGYLERSGFSVAGVAADGRQAIELLHRQPVQLVLLDIYLPGASGLQLLRELRAAGQEVEVIIVSAARDSLNKYQQKTHLLRKDFLDQREIDLLAAAQPPEAEKDGLPKGIDRITLGLISRCILELTGPFGVQEAADKAQISRVSAKKYLDFLCEQKLLRQTYVYGNTGRPASLYQRPADDTGLRRWLT